MATPAEVKTFDDTDPFLLIKRDLPDGRCLRLSLVFGGLSLTVAEDNGADFFDLRYDYTQANIVEALETAQGWDGTGEPCGYVRRFPPILTPVLIDALDDEETLPGADFDD